jgi:hypothetical protein
MSANDDNNTSTNENTGTGDGPTPGRRLKNPLGSLASYNYQVALYMITPDAYDAFTASGRTNIEALQTDGAGGAFLIAQSGGINNNNAKRAPGMELDYYLDNLEISQMVSGKASGTATNVSAINFTITEPYGFSFINKLKDASEALQQYSSDLGYSKGTVRNPTKQFFILGVSFLGYDIDGNPVTGIKADGTETIASTSNGANLFQNYHDIVISQIDFKIDGKIVTYKITAAALAPTLSFGVKRGRIPFDIRITAETIEEAMADLTKQLNNQQQILKDNAVLSNPNTFEAVFIGEGSDKLKNAKLVTPEDVDKFKWKGADAKNSAQATIATEVVSVPDSTVRQITYATGAALLEVFDDLIKQSTYLRDAMTTLYTTSLTPDKDKKDNKVNNPAANETVAWYHVTPQLSKAVWDPTTSDWSYHTTYVFETYQTPVISASYVNPGMNYYGPHKRYDYWYTGKNTEVLKYEQVLDNLYYNVVLGKTVAEANADKADSASTGGDTDTAVIPGESQDGPKIGKLGKGYEAQNSYVTSLYSPADYGSASVTILGDPDFIVQDQTSSLEDVYNRFYGSTGFNVNANGGQVFMEINFKEAIDYDESTGVLELNDNILFWEYPENIANIVEGVSYQVVNIKSMFKNGTFTQNLDCVINVFPNSDADNADGNDEREGDNTEQGSSSGPNAGDGNSTTNSPAGVTPEVAGDGSPAAGAPTTNANNNNSADDDANDADSNAEEDKDPRGDG